MAFNKSKPIFLLFFISFSLFASRSVFVSRPVLAQSLSSPGTVIIWPEGQNIKISWTKVNGADGYKIYKVIDRGTSPTEFFRASVDKNTILFTDIKGYGCPHAIRFGVSAIFGSSESGKTYSSSWVQRNCSCVDLDFNNNGLLDPTNYNSCTFDPSRDCGFVFSPPFPDFYYICQDYNKSGFYYTVDVNKDGIVDIFDLVIYALTYDGGRGCVCSVGPTLTPTPTLTPSPTSTPTPTLSPTPTPTSAPICPLAYSQDDSVASVDLDNNYVQYASFTAPYSGTLDRIQIKAGIASGSNSLTCKITIDSDGAPALGEASSTSFSNNCNNPGWKDIAFGGGFLVSVGNSYRVYCKKTTSAGGNICWFYKY